MVLYLFDYVQRSGLQGDVYSLSESPKRTNSQTVMCMEGRVSSEQLTHILEKCFTRNEGVNKNIGYK